MLRATQDLALVFYTIGIAMIVPNTETYRINDG